MEFTGGHLKMWHYFEHVLAHPHFEAVAQFTDRSLRSEVNPWCRYRDRVVSQRTRVRADALVLGGLDWDMLPSRQIERSRIPVVNLIQGVRHADPTNPRYRFLTHRAIRVCVSPEITQALTETGICNGPLITIPAAIDLGSLPRAVAQDDRPFDLLIAGKKAPALARKLEQHFARKRHRVHLVDKLIPHVDFLNAINQARVTLFLPLPIEGFYLPALEGMALRTLVVCPDVVGNRSFCIGGVNCFAPQFQEEALVSATEAALSITNAERSGLLSAASAIAAEHDLPGERAAFHKVLDSLPDQYWNG